jgi:hypothetical protein
MAAGFHTHATRWALVWIDSNDAYVVSWNGSTSRTQHFKSTVPEHHRATGGVRHAGGSGRAADRPRPPASTVDRSI